MRALSLSLALTALTACSSSDAPRPAGSSSAERRRQPSARAGASAAVPAPATATGSLSLRATTKVEQLVGDYDKHLKKATSGQTLTRYGVGGVDLGYSFEGDGKVLFLFGDTIGTEGRNGSDAIGFTDDDNPDDGVALRFFTAADGKYLPFRPRDAGGKEQRLMGFEVPVAGIRLGGETFVAYKDDHSGDESGSKDDDADEREPTDVTRLARFDEKSGEATTLRELSRQPKGRFQKISLHLPEPAGGDAAGLPSGGPWILMHGSARHGASHVYLAVVPTATFATCSGLRYFTGLEGSAPRWSEREADAAPVFYDGAGTGSVREVSVTWAAPIARWLALYDARGEGRRRVILRHAPAPWGPWSEPITVFDPKEAGFGVFIHDPSRARDDGQAGPMIGKNKDHPEGTRGTVYAPFVVERWTRAGGGVLTFYFTMSLWNPYVVVLMKTEMNILQ
jgi:hypothetical protein